MHTNSIFLARRMKRYQPRADRLAQAANANAALAGNLIDVTGCPAYIDEGDLADYAAYGLTETGWYAFLTLKSAIRSVVGTGFAVEGADAHIAPASGADSVNVAVKFGTAAQTKTVTVAWSTGVTETYYIRALDLAIRNLDYRATFYLYDMDNYAAYTWALTADTVFTMTSRYFTRSGAEGAYTYTAGVAATDYTVGDAVPADTWYIAGQYVPANTYYVHTGVRLTGFTQNVSYIMPIVDCPVTIDLPVVQGDEHYGSWFELRFILPVAKSFTLVPPTGVKVSGALGLSPGAGKNILSLQYFGIEPEWRQVTTTWAAPTGQS